jgi:peptide/nickel transport system ATP-binding protein
VGELTAVAEIEGLTVEVGGRRIVDGVSLRVLPGRVTALVGASGSGKTTTGRALLGEFPSGARVTGSVRVEEALVGYVPQHPAAVLNPARRVGALLYDIARGQGARTASPCPPGRGAAREHVLNALEMAQLPEDRLLRRFPHQLSGGQQQRVVLAQALLLGARVVVADEPTTGQDALTKRRVVEELAAVAARGIGVVLLSHDLETVRALADEVLVMRDGRVVESGPTERVWLAPSHPWTRELLAEQPTLRGDTGNVGLVHRAAGPRSPCPAPPSRCCIPRNSPCAPASASPSSAARAAERRRSPAVWPDSIARTRERCCSTGSRCRRSLRDRTRGQLAAVQYVFQDARASFDERRPVLDQVARTAVRLRGVPPREARAEAVEVLNSLGLAEELAARRPARLSGGELQRAALARALLARPRVLVCDEITSGLDTVTRRGILDLLAGLLRDRDDLSLVLITHDLDTARLASRIAVLDAGEVVEQGAAEDILMRIRSPCGRASWRSGGQIQPCSQA